MAAVNKYPWVRNLFGRTKPYTFMGLVQAGDTQEIKMGEICEYNGTATYFSPVDAVADRCYSLAIAAEEQKAGAASRYMKFFGILPGDVWEFELASAAQVSIGYALELTASNSQKLTYDADGDAVAFAIDNGNYPEKGTTLTSISYVQCVFNTQFSYIMQIGFQQNQRKVMAKTAAYTITPEDNGAIITNKGATGSVTLTGPSGTVPVGFNFHMAVMADQAFVFDPKPDTASVYVAGAAQTAGKYISVTDIADFVELVWDGTDWLAIASISGADGDISVET